MSTTVLTWQQEYVCSSGRVKALAWELTAAEPGCKPAAPEVSYAPSGPGSWLHPWFIQRALTRGHAGVLAPSVLRPGM